MGRGEPLQQKAWVWGKISEKRRELDQINSKIRCKESILQLDPLTAKTLHSLLQNGVSEQDIIDFGHLAQEYKDNNKSSSSSFGSGPNSMDNKTVDGWSYNHQVEKSSDIGKSLTYDLKKYGGIKLAIREQSEKLDRIKEEIKDSDKQKQEVLAYCHLAIALANIINYKISYLKGLLDHYFNQFTNTKIKPTSSSPIMLIFVVYDNKPGDKEKEKE